VLASPPPGVPGRPAPVVPPLQPGARIRVAHWAILDRATQPIASAAAGERVTLDLEPYRDNRQLEGFVLSDTLGRDPSAPLFLDVRP
jgi:hypothetical protein